MMEDSCIPPGKSPTWLEQSVGARSGEPERLSQRIVNTLDGTLSQAIDALARLLLHA